MKNKAKKRKIKAKKYFDYDDIEYERIRDIKNLYNDIDDDDYQDISGF